MKTIGMIGGTGWESTLEYYRILNEETHKRAGKHHSARLLMYSFDFQEIEDLAMASRFDELSDKICNVAKILKKAGADCLMLCANTLHMFAEKVEKETELPLIHIARATMAKIKERKISKVGLLGTKPTMEMDFYKQIYHHGGIEIVVPGPAERQKVSDIIFNELFSGILKPESRQYMISLMETMQCQGAGGAILGCTEIPLLIKQEHTSIPLFDTTCIHACSAVEFALED